MRTIIIQPDDAGQRLDRFLRKLLKKAPLSLIQKLIRKKKVKVAGKIRKGDYLLQPGDELLLFIREPEYKAYTLGITPERAVTEITFTVLYEDDDILVLDKPHGLPAHPGTGIKFSTLIDQVLQYFKDTGFASDSMTFRPALANRLDRFTSGVVLVGKTPGALRGLNEQLHEHTLHKEYLAIVHGIPAPSKGTLSFALEEQEVESGTIPKMKVGSGKKSITHYTTEETFTETTLLRLVLETGRTHQLRAHLAHIEHPIVGDTRYGRGEKEKLQLHAALVRFTHPQTGKEMTITAPVPKHMEKKLQWLRSFV